MGVMKIGCLGFVPGIVAGVLSGKLVSLICTGVIGILGGVCTGIVGHVGGVTGLTFIGKFICGIALSKYGVGGANPVAIATGPLGFTLAG